MFHSIEDKIGINEGEKYMANNNTILNAANRQGNGIMSHITTDKNSGSGIVIGVRGGASAPIVGPGGQNPLVRVQDRVVNSLIGTESLNSTKVHIGSVQKNINEALGIAKQYGNTELQQSLQSAKDVIDRANKLSGQQRNLALSQAQESLKSAGYQLQQQGYGSKHVTFQVPTPTIGGKGGAAAGIVGPGVRPGSTGGGANSPIVGPGGTKPTTLNIGGKGGASSPILGSKR